MDRRLAQAKKYFLIAAKVLREHHTFAPLVLASFTLLAGLAPIASAPWVSMRLSVYQLPLVSLVQFLLFPLLLGMVWLLERLVAGFARFSKNIYAIAAAVQVVSLFFLSSAAGRQLTAAIGLLQTRADLVPQRLSLGFYLLMIPAAAFLVYSGLRALRVPPTRPVVLPPPPQPAPVQLPPQQASAYYGQNPFDFSR